MEATLNPAANPPYPVQVRVQPALTDRNRLTTFFRFFLAIPHLILVGGPLAGVISWTWTNQDGNALQWGAGGGVLGVVAVVTALIGWFAIVFTGRYPEGLRGLVAYYLRWRVRAVAYTALLRDEYPPFGDGSYPAELELRDAAGERNRLTVFFRIFLSIPHLFAVWFLGVGLFFTTVFAWFAILFTGSFPESLYRFGVGVLRWTTRVEAYLLLLQDEYPPFDLEMDAPAHSTTW